MKTSLMYFIADKESITLKKCTKCLDKKGTGGVQANINMLLETHQKNKIYGNVFIPNFVRNRK